MGNSEEDLARLKTAIAALNADLVAARVAEAAEADRRVDAGDALDLKAITGQGESTVSAQEPHHLNIKVAEGMIVSLRPNQIRAMYDSLNHLARRQESHTGKSKRGPQEPPLKTKIALVEDFERRQASKGTTQEQYVALYARKIYRDISVRTFQNYTSDVRRWRELDGSKK